MRVLAIIPARGGSKGVPKKNIKKLNGKPLIQYTIEAALGSEMINEIVVSTDDKAIAKLSNDLGARVPMLRPPHLSNDKSPTIDTVRFTLEYFYKLDIIYDVVCLLQPTSPCRSPKDIDNAIRKFTRLKTDSLISVIPVPNEYNPYWTFLDVGQDRLELTFGKNIISQRQSLPTCFVRNGAIYLMKSSVIMSQNSLYGNSIGYYQMSEDNHVNIDTLDDWKKAEIILNAKK